jgi:carbamoyltransferase
VRFYSRAGGKGLWSMRILAFQSGLHDASAAAFEDYHLIAAVSEERLRREKGWGADIPWLAIDEVLQIAGWTRGDVDVLALIRGVFPLRYFRFPPTRDLYYRLRKRLGYERVKRDLSHAAIRSGTTPEQLFRGALFLAENGFRADAKVHFVNHHEAHALAALFYTDWDEGLIYTADGTGDNVSYSVRALNDGKLACLFGDDGWLKVRRVLKNSLATAYGHATIAAGFRMWRHEGKLTGLAAYGEPALLPALAPHFRLGQDGLIACDFRNWRSMEKTIMAICRGHSRETIAASVQQLVEDHILGAVKFCYRAPRGVASR